MERTQPTYFAAYHSLKLSRDARGVLIVEFHTNGGPLIFTAQDHTEFVDAFYRIAQDRANQIVIFTGTRGEFIPDIDFSSFGNVADPVIWSQVDGLHAGREAHFILASLKGPRKVIADLNARYAGAKVSERTLLPGDHARLAETRFKTWLKQPDAQKSAA